MKAIPTIPTGFGKVYEKDPIINSLLAIRECEANAQTFNCKNSHAFVAQVQGKNYLVFCHDGEPMKTQEELRLAVIPNITGARGNSFQGAGLTWSAAMLSQTTEIVVGSKNGDTLIWARAVADHTANHWNETQTSADFVEELTDKLGKQWINKFNVFYVFQFDLRGADRTDRSYLDASHMNLLPFLAPSLYENAHFRFCERQIGAQEYGIKTTKRSWGAKEYSCMSNISVMKNLSGEGQGGNPTANVIPLGFYDERFLAPTLDDDSKMALYEIPVPAFEFQVSNNPDMFITIAASSVQVRLYAGDRKGARNKENFFKNERDVSYGDHKAQKGKVSYPGIEPCRRGFLRYSCAGGEGHLARFKDNAVAMTPSCSDLVRALGLNYQALNDGPFAIIVGDLKALGPKLKVLNAKGEESFEAMNPILAANQFFDRRSDFMFGEKMLSRKLLKEMCEHASRNVSQPCRDLFDNHFQLDEEELVPLCMASEEEGEVGTRGASRFFVYDIETGMRSEGEMKSGEDYFVALYDDKRRECIKASELTGASRGVNISRVASIRHLKSKKAEAGYAKIKEELGCGVEIICIGVERMTRCVDGKNIPITARQYDRSDCSPHRIVKASVRGHCVKFGIVEDVPATEPGKPSVPSAGIVKKKTKGIVDVFTMKEEGNKTLQPYAKAHEDKLLTYHVASQCPLLNPDHPKWRDYLVKQRPTPTYSSVAQDMYSTVRNLCKAVYDTVNDDGVVVDTSAKEMATDGVTHLFDGNKFDFLMNKIVGEYLSSPNGQEYFKKLDSLRS